MLSLQLSYGFIESVKISKKPYKGLEKVVLPDNKET